MTELAEVVFDPWSPAVQDDPYPYYVELRDRTPVCRIAADDGWVVTRYEDVKVVTQDHRRFSVREGLGVRRDHMGGNVLVQTDPPVHTRSRRALQPLFLPKVLAGWRERAEAIADGLVDGMIEAGGRVEFKSAVALPLATALTIEVMGLPDDPARYPTYAWWSRRVMEDLDRREGDPDIADLHGTLGEAVDWFAELIEGRRRERRDHPRDLIDGIMLTAADGHTEDQITQIAMTVLAAGLANTADMMCHGMLALCDNPDQWAHLRGDPDGLAVATVEEAVRFGSPAHCVYRLALEDVELSGTVIPRNSRVMTLWGSANHDERVFPEPERFDLLREDRARHLGWGAGVHRCIGEHIARLEGVVLFRALGAKLAAVACDGPYEPYTTSAVRGFERLPVQVTAA